MAQVTDFTVGANPSGFDMRTELNSIIGAITTENSGASEPLSPFAYMRWIDTSNATYYYIKQRNHTNDAWVSLWRYTVATKVIEPLSGGNPVTFDLANAIHIATTKATPAAADELALIDSGATFGLKKLTWSNLNATLKTYFDTLYMALTGNQTIAGIKTFGSNPISTATQSTDVNALTRKDYVDSVSGISLATANSYDLGVGQTWQDVKASRAVATTYTNSTGKPIEVIIGTSCTVVGGHGRFLIDGLVVYTGQDYGAGTVFLSPLSFVVPNGSTYRYDGVNGTPSIHSWLELR